MNIKLEDDVIYRALDEYGSINKTAERLASEFKMNQRSLLRRVQRLKRRLDAEASFEAPVVDWIPPDDIPIEEIIDLQVRRSKARMDHAQAKRWRTVKIPVTGPFAVAWVGDPHVDSNGCNWPQLKADIDIMASTPGLYAANVGDTLDNWPKTGRLAALYAQSDTSENTAWKLAEWFLAKSGVNWLIWLMGNHDLWNGANAVFKRLGASKILMEDWGARIKLKPPAGEEIKVWLSHNFPGHSMWNSMHGPGKAAKFGEDCDVLVCGHTHTWALQTEENANRGQVYDLIRARGYKYLDDHAEKLGYMPQQYGATVVTVFDPTAANPMDRQQTFRSLERGADYLTWLRSK
jgi:hypothetical protein